MKKASGILLQSGELYDYIHPENNRWIIEDVALALSNICRYGGHVEKHYSVAQHSWYVSHAVDPRYALDGLCHDIAEAFLGDIPTPLKALLKDYRDIERLHEAEAFRRLGLKYPMQSEVHEADRAVLATEVFYLKPASEHWTFLKDVSMHDVEIKPWTQKKACKMFLARYYELTGARTIN